MSESQINASEQVFELSPNPERISDCCSCIRVSRIVRFSLYGIAAALLTGLVALQANSRLVNALGFASENSGVDGVTCPHCVAAAVGGCCTVEACPGESGCSALEARRGVAECPVPPTVPMPESMPTPDAP